MKTAFTSWNTVLEECLVSILRCRVQGCEGVCLVITRLGEKTLIYPAIPQYVQFTFSLFKCILINSENFLIQLIVKHLNRHMVRFSFFPPPLREMHNAKRENVFETS